jgi:hypothetical protein
MSEALSEMSVAQARTVLSNVRGLSNDETDAAQRIIDRFQAERPRNRHCVACSCARWEERRMAAGDAVWCCASCGRSEKLTAEEWHAAETTRRKAADAHLRATEAAAPKPRDVLKQALAKQAEAHATVVQLDRAVPIARVAVTEAQARHDRAVEAAEAANATSAEYLAVAFFEGTRPTDPARAAAAARGELAAAVDALVIAKNARTILDSKLKDAQASVGYASDRARKAARGVIAAERLEELLTDAAEFRAQYLETVGQLGWLIQSHAIPNGDSRPHQFLGEANTPPSTWREAATAGTAQMEAAMAALLADSEAPIQ